MGLLQRSNMMLSLNKSILQHAQHPEDSTLLSSGVCGEGRTSNAGDMQKRWMDPSVGVMTASGHAQAALAAMPPLHQSNTDGPRRHVLPKKASFKSKGSILSHVTSGTWEEDADIENPHDAEEARKSPRVGSAAKSHLTRRQCCVTFSAGHETLAWKRRLT